MTTTVKRCARCGLPHASLKVRRFRRPPRFGPFIVTHWMRCPETGEPIMTHVSQVRKSITEGIK